jgi:hypothetical protein
MVAFSSMRRAFVSLAAVMLAPLAAHAQESPLFTWSGRVDREVRLTMRGPQAANTYENSIDSRSRFRVNSALPMRDGTLRIVREAGRGDVSVIEQPAANNGYTAIIRIADNEGGADNYRVSAYYTALNDGRYGRNGNRGRGHDDQGGYNQGRDNQNDDQNDDQNRDDRRRDDRGRDDRGRDDGRRGDRGRDNQGRDGRDDRGRGDNYGQDGAALRWSGDVDSEVLISWRGNDVSQRTINGAPVRIGSSNVTGDASRARGGQLLLNTREGRGRVEVVQQPSAMNGYTSIIRIIDPERGYGHYDITASLR